MISEPAHKAKFLAEEKLHIKILKLTKNNYNQLMLSQYVIRLDNGKKPKIFNIKFY